MSSQSQEMLQRPKPKEQQPQEQETKQEEDIKFDSNGGGGGPPKAFFKSYSNVSSVVCRPDPENPGRQICTRTEKSNSFDPFEGHSSREKRSEETRDQGPMRGFLGRLLGGRQPEEPSMPIEPPLDNGLSPGSQTHPPSKPVSMVRKVLDFFDMNEDKAEEPQHVSYNHTHGSNFDQDYQRAQQQEQQEADKWDHQIGRGHRGQGFHPGLGMMGSALMGNPFQMMEQMEREFFGHHDGYHNSQHGSHQGGHRDDFIDDFFGRGQSGPSGFGQPGLGRFDDSREFGPSGFGTSGFGRFGGQSGFGQNDPFAELHRMMREDNMRGDGQDPRFDGHSSFQTFSSSSSHDPFMQERFAQEEQDDRFSRRGRPHFNKPSQTRSNFVKPETRDEDEPPREPSRFKPPSEASNDTDDPTANIRFKGQIYDV